MHSAPSVVFPVGRSRGASGFLWAIWAAGACCAAAYSYQINSGTWRFGVLFGSVALAGIAVRHALARPVDSLDFDGQRWSLAGAPSFHIVEVAVVLDFQFLLLMRLLGADGRSQWHWLERRSDPARWQDLRRAAYARRPAAEGTAAPAVK